MGYTPHYIANYEEDSGLETYHEPFLIPEKAFSVIEDALVWRGRVIKRRGFTHLGRLRRVLAAEDMGNIVEGWAGVYPHAEVFSIFTGLTLLATEPNAQLQPGTIADPLVITIAGGWTITDTLGDGTTTVVGGAPITSATINYALGNLTIIFSAPFVAAAATFTGAYYPTLPVMGLKRREIDDINNEELIAFDQKYAYEIFNNQFRELPATTPTVWNGNDAQFFWTTNYFNDAFGKIIWATNFNISTPDPIRYWNSVDWTNFAPIVAADNVATPTKLLQCKIMLAYKNRLIAMNTYEGDFGTGVVHYPNRVRFCQNGTPLTIGVVGAGPKWTTVGAWASDIPGYGGYVDIPTSEQIVTAEFVRDVLLIKCERSSYKLTYTGIRTTPFALEKINTELGAESTFSAIPFDNGILTVGNYAITLDDSVNVTRIDVQIPYQIFDIKNRNSGVDRVHGIRDFYLETVYWTYTDWSTGKVYPNKLLVYNYRNQTFSIFNDSFTCLGYYQRGSDVTWATLSYDRWDQWEATWGSGSLQSQFPLVVAGNQVGYVSVLDESSINEVSLPISGINGTLNPTQFTCPNHNLISGTFVKVTGIIAATGPPDYSSLNGKIYLVRVLSNNVITLQDSTFANVNLGPGGNYIGGGQLSVVNNFKLKTKAFAPFYEQGGQARLGYVDFLLDKTNDGEVTAQIFIDECGYFPSIKDPANTFGNLGSNIILTRPENLALIPLQQYQSKIWHRQYVQTICQNFCIELSMSNAQMFDEDICSEDFTMHAMVLYISKNARLIQ